MEQHLDRVNMRNQMIAYLLSASNLKAQELEALLKNIFSPVLKQEVMIQGSGFIAVAAREAEERTRKEEKIAAKKKKRLRHLSRPYLYTQFDSNSLNINYLV